MPFPTSYLWLALAHARNSRVKNDFECFIFNLVALILSQNLKIMTMQLSLSQGIKRILAFLRLHEKHARSCCCCCFFLFVCVLTWFFISGKSLNCPYVFDIAYQLLIHHPPFALLFVKWWMNGKAFTIINPRSCLYNKQNNTQLLIGF